MVERGIESSENAEQFEAPQTEGEESHNAPITQHSPEHVGEAPEVSHVNPSKEKVEKSDEKHELPSVEEIFSETKAIDPPNMEESVNSQFETESKDAA